jgi:hypothetical protein
MFDPILAEPHDFLGRPLLGLASAVGMGILWSSFDLDVSTAVVVVLTIWFLCDRWHRDQIAN